jgi:F-type H+-transporting ATPase subunit delta
MLTNPIAQKYAQAIYEIACDKNMLEQVEEQLKMIAATLSETSDLPKFLYHPLVQAKAKHELIAKVFAQEVADFVYTFLLLLVDKRRETLLPDIIREFNLLANQARNIVEADVTVAMPLQEAEQLALARKLGAITGKNVLLHVSVDERILGGVIVKIGDKLIDGSVARQLHMLQSALSQTPVA